jgi:hypothetical protein
MVYLTRALSCVALLVGCVSFFILALEEMHLDALSLMSYYPFTSLSTMLVIAVIGFFSAKKVGRDRRAVAAYILSALTGVALLIGCVALFTLAFGKMDIDARWLMGRYPFVSLPAMLAVVVMGFLLGFGGARLVGRVGERDAG